MGRLWRRKPVVESAVVDRSSGLDSVTGGLMIQKQQRHPKLVESRDFGSPNKYSVAFQQDRSYVTHSSGSSVRQLLSDEMSKEREQKRRLPSIIARLMGFEGLPPQEPTHNNSHINQAKFQMASFENCVQRKTSKQQQQFKDVFEIPESTKDENHVYQSRRFATSDISEAEMAFLRQKFNYAKCLAGDEKSQGSKELNDTLEVLESNKELVLKLLQEPDSMLSRHLHDFRTPNASQCSHTYSKEPIGNQSFRNRDRITNLGRESSRDGGTTRKHSNDSPFYRTERLGHSKSNKCPDGTDDISTFPTMIVILKPNIRRVQVSEVDSDGLSSVSDFESNTTTRNMRTQNNEHGAKKHFSDDLLLPQKNARESRELAKRVAQKIRSFHTGSLDFSIYRLQDYNGDRSSSYESGNESSNGSDYKHYPKCYPNKNKVPLSHLPCSSASKEATKRLSERWKMTKRFQEMGLNKSSTLGEMLSVPESRKESKIVILAGNGSTKDHTLNNLGISRRDGWKYGPGRTLLRSTSVPVSACSDSFGTLKSTMRHNISNDDMHLMKRTPLEYPSKEIKKSPCHKEGLKNRSRISKSKRLHSNTAPDNFSGEYVTSQTNDIPILDEILHEKEIIVPEISVLHSGLVIDDAQLDTLAMSLCPPEEHLCRNSKSTGQSEIQSPKIELGTCNTQNLSGQKREGCISPSSCHYVDPESPSRSKDAEQPSPMSVLDFPFPEDISSHTECFGSLTADLKGLRLQLQLLKQDSESYADDYITIASSEDDESFGVPEKRSLVAVDSLDSSYITDALTNMGFYDEDSYTFMARWHSLECPMSPSEFEKLEAKYGEQAIWSRSERRLLFDLMNSGIVDIFRQFHEQRHKSEETGNLEEKLLKWLQRLQVKITEEVDGTTTENTVGKELEWYDSAHHIKQIGSKVEGLLTDELMAEIFNIW